MTVLTESEILSSIVPKAKVDSVTFESRSSGSGMIVTVRYSIYDIVGRDMIGQWFKNVDYEKYFLIQARLSGRYERRNNSGPIMAFQEVENIKTTDITPEIITDISSGEGSEIKRFNFISKIILRGAEPVKNMNFQIITKYDIDAMERDLNIDIFSIFDSRNMSNEDFNGDGFADILANYETKEIIKDGIMIYPVRDFRVTSRSYLESRQAYDSTSIISEYQQRYDAQMVQMDTRRAISNCYLSDFWITRSAQGGARFLFIYDPNSYFSNNSVYRNFYKKMTKEEKKTVIANMEIPSLKILRKRVIKEQSSDGYRIVEYKDRDTEKVIVETSKTKDRRSFIQSSNGLGRIRQIDIYCLGVMNNYSMSSHDFAVRDILSALEGTNADRYLNNELFFLTGDDLEISAITQGDYIYGVEVTVADNMKKYLVAYIQKLIDASNNLKSIHEELYNSPKYDIQNNIYLENRTPTDILGEDLYQRFNGIISCYRDSMRIFSNSDDTSEAQQKFLALFSENSQVPVDIYSIRALIGVIDTLTNSAIYSIGESIESTFSNIGSNFSGATSSAKQIIRDRTKSTKYYDSVDRVFSVNVPKRCFLDYLSNFSEYMDPNVLQELNSLAADTGEIGVRVIDGASFDARMETELSRVFSANSGDIVQSEVVLEPGFSITGQGSEFLLPSSVVSQGTAHNTLEDALDILYMTDRFAITREQDILDDHNIVFTNYSEREFGKTVIQRGSGIERFSSYRTQDLSTPPIEDVLISVEEREQYDSFERYVYGKIKQILPLPEPTQERIFADVAHLQNHRRYEYSTEEVSREEFGQNMPNLVRALVSPDQELIRNFSESLQGQATVYSEFLTKVEFLEGFSPSATGNSVKNPVWRPLTIERYRQNTDKNLLCRITPTEYSSIGIRTNISGSPIYDSFFVVRPVNSPSIATPAIFLIPSEIEDTSAIDAVMRVEYQNITENLRIALESMAEMKQIKIRMQRLLDIPQGERNAFTSNQIMTERQAYEIVHVRMRSHIMLANTSVLRLKELSATTLFSLPISSNSGAGDNNNSGY